MDDPLVQTGWLALEWSIHPSIPIGIAIFVGLYLWAIGPLRRRLALGPPVPWEEQASFLVGNLILFLAITGPIHDLSDSYLFSVHMTQHVIITLVVPPLLLIGTPDWLVRFLLRPRALNALVRRFGSAHWAFLIFNGTLAVWHAPVLYNSALIRVEVHVLEHLLFIGTAFVGWWPILAPANEYRGSMVVQFVYMLVVTFPMKLIALMLLFASAPLYPAYVIAPRVFGLDPLTDQGIAGLIMLIPAGFIFFIVLGAHFFRWWDEARAQERGETNVVPLNRERAT